MAKKKKAPSKPSKAYLVSFGDTMTAMLAFFIVLNTLAQEQTGANLHSGTGSFVAAVRGFGLPGVFDGNASRRIAQGESAAPKYIVDDRKTDGTNRGTGPDEYDNELPVNDRDKEQLQRRLTELEQQFDVNSQSESSSFVSFDLFERVDKRTHALPKSAKRVLAQSIGLLTRGNYRIEIDFWSPTPSQSALSRTAKLAFEIQEKLVADYDLSPARRKLISSSTRVWQHSDEKRPVLTINVVKISRIP